MKTAIILVISALIYLGKCTNLYAQDTSLNKSIFKIEELQKDFSVFRSCLEESHPGLYIYKSKTKLDSIFDATYSSLNTEMTGREFMLLTCRVAVQIGDGHLRIVPPKMQLDSLDGGPTAFPFSVYWYKDKLYVNRNYSALSDEEFLGSQIISINGHLIENFISEYLKIFPSDGNNITRKYRLLSSSRLFTRYFSMLYGYAEKYDIEYIPLNKTTHMTKTLQGLIFDNLINIRKERYPDSIEDQKPASFNISEDKKYAILRICSFDKSRYRNSKINFEKFLIASFKKMESDNVSNLIIDVRDNGGGTDEYGRILFSHFINHDFDYYKSLRMNKESFESFNYTSRPGMKAPKGLLEPNNEGTFNVVNHPNVGKQNPIPPIYTGNIYVLINGWSFSTTSEFLSMLHYHTKAIFIGEESGGGYYGNCSGPTPDFTLPNTKVRMEIPLMNYRMAIEDYQYSDRGLFPNFIVIPGITDKINSIDIELEFTKNIINDN